MDQDYRAILKGLYDTFGENVIRLAKAKLADQIQNGGHAQTAGQASSARDDGDWNSEDADTNRVFDGEFLDDEEESREYGQDQKIYFDADRFQQRNADKIKVGVAMAGTSSDIFKVLVTLVEGAVEVAKFEEAQITVRTDISARRDIALAQIENQKNILLAYLDKSFDERKDNFEKLFSVVDHALEANNMEELGLGLQSIIKLAESSPFKDLASIDATAAALGDPDHEWDF